MRWREEKGQAHRGEQEIGKDKEISHDKPQSKQYRKSQGSLPKRAKRVRFKVIKVCGN